MHSPAFVFTRTVGGISLSIDLSNEVVVDCSDNDAAIVCEDVVPVAPDDEDPDCDPPDDAEVEPDFVTLWWPGIK